MDEKFSMEVDKIADERGWFRPDDDEFSKPIESWINNNASLQETIEAIVTPVNKAYTSKSKTPPTTEGYLWELWYTVLHEAKKIPWHNQNAQERLIKVVAALKDQPDPETSYEEGESKGWFITDGKLWGSLSMLGPATRETWNDSPGCGAGFEDVEAQAWTNVNAFVARLTAAGIRDFWLYAIWALRDALEEDTGPKQSQHITAESNVQLNALVPAACVWILILDKDLYNKEEDLRPKEPGHGNPAKPGKFFGRRKGKSEFSKARWAFWKERLGDLRNQEDLSQDTRDIANKTYERMVEIENGTGGS